MIFGDAVDIPTTTAPTDWIAAAREGMGTVGALVPNGYPMILRVHAPDAGVEDWWSAYRELFRVIAEVGERHTSTADRGWFAVWEGHGFANSTTHIAVQGPLDDAARTALAHKRLQLRIDDERRNAAINAALSEVPRFELPHRAYYLLTGPVAAATELNDPGAVNGHGWHHPDLFWPDDRRWFVATDVDIWSLYVGGELDFITELSRRVPTRSEMVTRDHRLEVDS